MFFDNYGNGNLHTESRSVVNLKIQMPGCAVIPLRAQAFVCFLREPLCPFDFVVNPQRPFGELTPSTTSPDQSDNEQEYDCSNECYEDCPRKSRQRNGDSHHPEEPSTNKCSDYSDYDIADESVACSAHDERGEDAGDKSNDEPGKDVHEFLRFRMTGHAFRRCMLSYRSGPLQ